MEQRSSHWTDFHEISYLEFLLKFVGTFWFWLKLDKNNRCFVWRPKYIHVICFYNGNRLLPVRYEIMPEKHLMIWTSHICEPSIGNGICHHLWDRAELVRNMWLSKHVFSHKKQKRSITTFTLHWKYSQTVGIVGSVWTITEWMYQKCCTMQTFLTCYSIGLVFQCCTTYRISWGFSWFFSVFPSRCQDNT